MKIGWVNLLPYETKRAIGMDLTPVWRGFETYFRKFSSVRENVQVKIYYPEKSGWAVHFPYIEFLNNRWFVEAAVKAQREGCDAVVPGAATDSGLPLLRELLDIPVVGVTEAATMMAPLLGASFAGVTVFERLVPSKARIMKAYGYDAKAIPVKPVRSCELDMEEVQGLFDEKIFRQRIVPKFEKTAKECIADGAEVIIALDAWLAPAMTVFNYNTVKGTSVPVLDATAAALLTVMNLADMRKAWGITTSRKLSYQRADLETLNKARKEYGVEPL